MGLTTKDKQRRTERMRRPIQTTGTKVSYCTKHRLDLAGGTSGA